ncbi:MAG: creatininase family protein [Actinomycetota bacterium]|nr:creatininase family protein [Actinomycetota bacterium]
MFTVNNSTTELSDAHVDTAIISVGATEQCGPRLLLHLDSLLAGYYARAWGEALGVFVLPTLCYSTSEDRIQDIEGHQLGSFHEGGFLEARMLPPPYLRYVIWVDPRRGGPTGDAAVAAFDRATVFKRSHPVAYHLPPPT